MSAARRAGRDRRTIAIVAAFLAIVAGGAALQWATREPATGDDRRAHAESRLREEFDRGFRQAVLMLHAREYEHAIAALHRLLRLAPQVPEVHVNMGFALLGAGRHGQARDFFQGACALSPNLANAYYGLAMAHEGLGDLAAARGAMRTFVHLTRPDDPHLPKARAALWEWQSPGAADSATKEKRHGR